MMPSEKQRRQQGDSLHEPFTKSELVIGLVGAVGTNLTAVVEDLCGLLAPYSYDASELRISRQIIPEFMARSRAADVGEFKRISDLMDAGDAARERTGDNAILAVGAAAKIFGERMGLNSPGDDGPAVLPQRAFVINSLKRPEEVEQLRELYTGGFYLIGVYADEDKRRRHLARNGQMTKPEAEKLMRRDEDEDQRGKKGSGQLTRETFHMADFFVHDLNPDMRRNSLERIVEILFGHPYRTPTFDEFAMFMAFSSALRSGDLSRQVGAVIARDEEILATGANDCPRYGGGLYWPQADPISGQVTDTPEGRDFKRGFDSNKREKELIAEQAFQEIKDMLKRGVKKDDVKAALSKGRIKDITEYGRVVHAEMEALLSCARNHVSCRGATLYCTTFPCHNCAKHLIAAGITRVVYVEPYPKSKAPEFHDDSMALGFEQETQDLEKVCFEPFVGVGPRNFVNLFSLGLGRGYQIERKKDGKALKWGPEEGILRLQMLPYAYLEREVEAAAYFAKMKHKAKGRKGKNV